jgi:hypothetical protein
MHGSVNEGLCLADQGFYLKVGCSDCGLCELWRRLIGQIRGLGRRLLTQRLENPAHIQAQGCFDLPYLTGELSAFCLDLAPNSISDGRCRVLGWGGIAGRGLRATGWMRS